jgi:hypothetical protein
LKGLTADQHVLEVTLRGQQLAEALKDAGDEGVGPAVLLPALVTVFRDAGMMPGGLESLGGLGGLAGLAGGT